MDKFLLTLNSSGNQNHEQSDEELQHIREKKH